MPKRQPEVDLDMLRKNNGDAAVIWYLWRRALRSLLALGNVPLAEVGKEHVIHDVHSACRGVMILALWPKAKTPKAIQVAKAAARSASSAVANAAENFEDRATQEAWAAFADQFLDHEIHGVAIYAAIDALNDVGNATAYASENSSIGLDQICEFNESDADFNTTSPVAYAFTDSDSDADSDADADADSESMTAVEKIADDEKTNDRSIEVSYGGPSKVGYLGTADEVATRCADMSELVSGAAKADYNFLSRHREHSDEGSWYSRPLWDSGDYGHKGEPSCAELSHSMLVRQLLDLGLGFLVDDMNALWAGQSLPARAENYLKNLSVTVTNNAVLLARAIQGEQVKNIHAVRVLLLGPGGAGKSSLADRLQGKDVEQIKALTVGINYQEHQPLRLGKIFPEIISNDNNLDLFLWDFGGQTIFHGLHSAFLHENCVYVLVVDSRHEQAPDEWLYQIRHLAGAKVKVLLVTNWYERCESRQNETRLLREFLDLLHTKSFFYFSCQTVDSPEFKLYVKALVADALESQRMVLKETIDVQHAMMLQYRDTAFLKEQELKLLIERKINRSEDVDSMLNQLEQLGFLVRVETGYSRYCLKPDWAVDNAYRLLYLPELRDANGVMRLSELESLLKDAVREDDLEYLVRFLQERHLCHQLHEMNGSFFFPDAANSNEPKDVGVLYSESCRLTLRFDLPYFPLGLHARLVHKLFLSEHNVHILQHQDIWREGFILRTEGGWAAVGYRYRRSAIELTMAGNISTFASIFRRFNDSLVDVMISGPTVSRNKVYISLLHDQKVISVQSDDALIDFLRGIDHYNDLIRRVNEMSEKGHIIVKGNHNVVGGSCNIVGNSNSSTVRTYSSDFNIAPAAEQLQSLDSILDAVLRRENIYSAEAVAAASTLKRIIAAKEDDQTRETKVALARVWNELRKLTGFSADLAEIGGFVLNHAPAISAIITVAAGLLS